MTANVVQDLTALPSRCTTQAPHCDVSQPTWVPVSRRFSRRNWTNRVRGSILALTGLPFTIIEILAIQHSLLLHRRISGVQSLKAFQSHNMCHHGNEQPHLGHGLNDLTGFGRALRGFFRESALPLYCPSPAQPQPCTALA